MGLQYSAAISKLLKAIRIVPFNLTIKDDKLSGVYEHGNTTTRINYSSKHGYELYVIRGNVIEFSYITNKLTNFVNVLNDVMKGVVTEVDHEEVLQLKQRIVELEQLVKLSNVRYMVGTVPVNERISLDELISKVNTANRSNSYKMLGIKPAEYGYGISSSDGTWKPYDYTERKFR